MHNLWIHNISLAISAADTKPPKILKICFRLWYLPPATLYSASQTVLAFYANLQFVGASQPRDSYALPYCYKVCNHWSLTRRKTESKMDKQQWLCYPTLKWNTTWVITLSSGQFPSARAADGDCWCSTRSKEEKETGAEEAEGIPG